MKTTDLGVQPCPACGTKLSAASSIFGEHVPSPGDATVCLECGHLMVFGDGLVLRDPTDAEMLKMAGDRRILEVQKARGSVMKNRRKS